jgi:hypothetical protein
VAVRKPDGKPGVACSRANTTAAQAATDSDDPPTRKDIEDYCYRLSRLASKEKGVPIECVCFSGRAVDAIWNFSKTYTAEEVGDAWAGYLDKYRTGDRNDLKYLVSQFCRDAATILRAKREAAAEQVEQERRAAAKRAAEEHKRAIARQIAGLRDKRVVAALAQYDSYLKEHGTDDGFSPADPEAFDVGMAGRKQNFIQAEFKSGRARFFDSLEQERVYSNGNSKLFDQMISDPEFIAIAEANLAKEDRQPDSAHRTEPEAPKTLPVEAVVPEKPSYDDCWDD